MLRVILKPSIGVIVAIIFYAIGAAVFDKITGVTETALTLKEPLGVWVFGIVGFGLGYKYAFKVIAAFIDNLGLL